MTFVLEEATVTRWASPVPEKWCVNFIYMIEKFHKFNEFRRMFII